MKRFKELALLVLYTILLASVVALHYGCEEEPTGPDCGEGPFIRDSKTFICKSASTGLRVDSSCCP